MKGGVSLVAALWLVGCSTPSEEGSEAVIANRAADLERRTMANVDRTVSAIEADGLNTAAARE